MGVSWEVPYLDSEPGKSKGLAKQNPEEIPHKNNSNYKSTTQRLSLSLPFSPPNKYCSCFATFRLCGNSVSAKQKGQGLVTDHWCNGEDLFTLPQHDLSLWSGTKALLQVSQARDQLFSVLNLTKLQLHRRCISGNYSQKTIIVKYKKKTLLIKNIATGQWKTKIQKKI